MPSFGGFCPVSVVVSQSISELLNQVSD